MEDSTISRSDFRALLSRGKPIHFVRCRFLDETVLMGEVPGSVLFQESEFYGHVDIRAARTKEVIRFDRCVFHHALEIVQSHLGGPLLLDRSIVRGGLVMNGSVLAGEFQISASTLGSVDVESTSASRGMEFRRSKILGAVRFRDAEIDRNLRFEDCEFGSGNVLRFDGGSVEGTIRFDGSRFDKQWGKDGEPANAGGAAEIRLSDLSVGAGVVLTPVGPGELPTIQVSRCIMPLLLLPEWHRAKGMLMANARLADARGIEELGESLRLARASYENTGRMRDALAVGRTERRITAGLKGRPVLFLRILSDAFGSGIYWLIGLIVSFTVVYVSFGRTWGLYENRGRWLRAFDSVDLSVRGLFGSAISETGLRRSAIVCVRLQRILGLLFAALFALMLNEWFSQ